MPFIAQCPYPSCRKYLLLEDSSRGSSVGCLLCKQPIRVSAAPLGQPPVVEMAGPPAPVRVASPTQTCPQCGASLLARGAQAALQKVKCGKCGHVFQAA